MDLEVIETGDGGDIVKKPKDFSVIFGFENMPYLGMFGGNQEQSTPLTRLPTEQDFSFWGNNLLHPGDPSVQFNSETQRALNEVPLTSFGRPLIQQAVQKDLAFMQDFANVSVEVIIPATDTVIIGIRLQQPDNLQTQDYVYIWSATKQELLKKDFETITPNVIRVKYFDLFFDLFFN